jgi:Transglutaminase-like superfamily
MAGRAGDSALLRHEPAGAVVRLRLFVEIWVAYAQVRRLLRRHDIAQVVAALRDSSVDDLDPATARRLAKRLAHAVERTLRFLRRDSRCLTVSLVLLRMMARRGAHCSLLIGTRSEGAFEAHAWVEHDGTPLLPTRGYASLTAI